jgi:hypothetical protein
MAMMMIGRVDEECVVRMILVVLFVSQGSRSWKCPSREQIGLRQVRWRSLSLVEVRNARRKARKAAARASFFCIHS